MPEIHLDGGEVTVIKAIGLGGSPIDGEQLVLKVNDFADAELIDSLHGLIMMGYILSDKQSLHNIDDVKRSTFRINSGYLRDIREALDPRRREQKPSRRVRRE